MRVPELDARALRARREQLGLTQAELATLLGVAPNTVARWERGERQITHAALVSTVLRALDGAQNGQGTASPGLLPPISGRLIGREREIEAIRCRLVQEHRRLVTLTGPGGTGKTRLALEAASELNDCFRDGAVFVDLSSISQVALVPAVIARALDLPPAGQKPPALLLLERLADRQHLLVLDNVEHLLAAAPLVADIVAASPGTCVLATSREPLHLDQEIVVPVPPLAVPDLDKPLDAASLAEVPAVRLFVERAQAVRAGFVLDQANAPAVAELCVELDGLPLAIELAAARVRLLDPRAILARLGRRLEILTRGPDGRVERHQTLRAALEWSYELLSEEERALFRRLGIFLGGCSLEAVEAVYGPKGELGPGVLDRLASLVDKNLVLLDHLDNGEPRFRLLEALRAYAHERLVIDMERDSVADRHAHYFLSLAERLEPQQLAGPEQTVRVEALDLEQSNLRSALEWLRAHEQHGTALRLAALLWRYWWTRGYYDEGREFLDTLLDNPQADVDPATRAKALAGSGELARMQCDYPAARARHLEGLSILRSIGDSRGAAVALRNVGLVAIFQNDFDEARRALEESLAMFRALGDRVGTAMALNILGEAAEWSGDPVQARRLSEESLRIRRELGDRWAVASSLQNVANAALELADFPAAASAFREALPIWREHADRWRVAYALEGCAQLAAGVGLASRAVRLARAASALRQAIGAAPPSGWQVRIDKAIEPMRRLLGRAAFAEAEQDGCELSWQQAVAEALDFLDLVEAHIDAADPGATPPEQARHGLAVHRLTAREREVAGLLAEGLTNRQIAQRLVLSDRTVGAHVQNILGKLGFASRAQVAVWAAQNGLATTELKPTGG